MAQWWFLDGDLASGAGVPETGLAVPVNYGQRIGERGYREMTMKCAEPRKIPMTNRGPRSVADDGWGSLPTITEIWIQVPDIRLTAAAGRCERGQRSRCGRWLPVGYE